MWKNLTTCCLPEMANHGSIKIRVGKKAQAFHRSTRIKEWQQLAIPVWRKKSMIGWEIANETFERVIIYELQNASAINFVQDYVSSILPPLTDEIKRKPSYLFYSSTSSLGSILFYVLASYSYNQNATILAF